MIQTKHVAEIFFKESRYTEEDDFSGLMDALESRFDDAEKVYEIEDTDLVGESLGDDGNYIIQFYGFNLAKVTEFYNTAIRVLRNHDYEIKKLEYK